ncbi:hypothetical protein BJF78_19475 [Pseudonocardia sp. CNS-139]|nr:hypothetical protein BJF78_19475 [Pseudonocardia sp. CNS-139]
MPRVSVTDQVVSQLHHALADGTWKAGDRLPSENELATRFDVSRTAIREAVQELMTLGFLEIRRGVGTFVIAAPSAPAAGWGELREEFRRVSVRELLEIRMIIEPEIAALAAERATENQVQRLREDVAELHEATPGSTRHPADLAFHLHLVEAAHNKLLTRLTSLIIDFYKHDESATRANDYLDHRTILGAIEARDADWARAAMRSHLAATRAHALGDGKVT